MDIAVPSRHPDNNGLDIAVPSKAAYVSLPTPVASEQPGSCVRRPTVVLRPNVEDGWAVRMPDTAVAEIDKDVQKWNPLETRGALVGHIDLPRAR